MPTRQAVNRPAATGDAESGQAAVDETTGSGDTNEAGGADAPAEAVEGEAPPPHPARPVEGDGDERRRQQHEQQQQQQQQQQ